MKRQDTPQFCYDKGNLLFNELMNWGTLIFKHPQNQKYVLKYCFGDRRRWNESPLFEHATLEETIYIGTNARKLMEDFNDICVTIQEKDPELYILASSNKIAINKKHREKIQSQISAALCKQNPAISLPCSKIITQQLVQERFSRPNKDTHFIKAVNDNWWLSAKLKCLRQELKKNWSNTEEFQKHLGESLTPLIKIFYSDPTTDAYQFTCHKVPGEVGDCIKSKDDFIKNFLSSIPQSATTLDLSEMGFHLPEELLHQLPKNLNKIIFSREGYWHDNDKPELICNYLSFLPPHIKEISISLFFPLPTPFSRSINDRIRNIARGMPCTLERARIGSQKFDKTWWPTPKFPKAYEEVFNAGMQSSQEAHLPPLSKGIKELLKYYLGTDQRSKNEFIYTMWRTKHRQHHKEVDAIVKKIGTELKEPEDILYALKRLRPTNAKGGLQTRIHFIQDVLAKANTPETTPQLNKPF